MSSAVIATAITILSLIGGGKVEACGPTAHIEISHRALKYFSPSYDTDYRQLLEKHQDAFTAGSTYPDAYYPDMCVSGKYHDISEDTHWAPFLNASVNYIRRKYPKPWDKATEKLVTFLFGVVSHQIADILWHSLGIDQGFLETMGKVNFHGSFADAHNVGDIGGDIADDFELNMTYDKIPMEWYIPTDDLFRIYQDYYGSTRLPKPVIEECCALLLITSLADRLAASKLFPFYADKSPFMVDQLTNFFLGGIDDMAGWTQRLWNTYILMMDKGTEHCDIPRSTLLLNCNKTRENKPFNDKKIKNGYYAKRESHGLSLKDVTITRYLRGVQIKMSPDIEKRLLLKKNYAKPTSVNNKHKATMNLLTPSAIYTTDVPYSKFGWSLKAADVNNDGIEDLVVGAPVFSTNNSYSQGAVFWVNGTKNGLPLVNLTLDSRKYLLPGQFKAQSKFGSSVVILDIDLDGINDIAVGAPSMESEKVLYKGEVLIYLGKKKGGFSGPIITVTCKLHYCNLGYTINAGDIDNDGHPDLIITSPFAPYGSKNQSGVISVVLADKKYRAGSWNIEATKQEYLLYGSQNYGWFGYNVMYKKISKSRNIFAVGEPTYRLCAKHNCSFSQNDTQSVGRVVIYIENGTSPPALVSIITGNIQFGQLGTSFDVGRPYKCKSLILAVSAPTVDVKEKFFGWSANIPQLGEVYLYNLTESVTKPKMIGKLSGDRMYGRFGRVVKFADVNRDGYDDLLIGAPLRTDDITEELHGAEQGMVYIFYGGENFPFGDVGSRCSSQAVTNQCTTEKESVILKLDENQARFGSNIEVVTGKNKTQIFVSAEHSSMGARLSGAVTVFEL